jgi:acyl-CoA thioester hydrolase
MPPNDRFVAETTFYVRYAETDQMGIVHHASYVVWLEEARSHFSRVRGAAYDEFEAGGLFLAVTEIDVRYIAPAHYGEQVTCCVWADNVRSRKISFGYEIVNAESGDLLVTAKTSHICIDKDGRVRRLPAEWHALSEAK